MPRPGPGARAVAAVLFALVVPIDHDATTWWQTLHQGNTLLRANPLIHGVAAGGHAGVVRGLRAAVRLAAGPPLPGRGAGGAAARTRASAVAIAERRAEGRPAAAGPVVPPAPGRSSRRAPRERPTSAGERMGYVDLGYVVCFGGLAGYALRRGAAGPRPVPAAAGEGADVALTADHPSSRARRRRAGPAPRVPAACRLRQPPAPGDRRRW